MADQFDDPISTHEACALGDGFTLFRKVCRILAAVGKHANAVWPGSRWPSTETEVISLSRTKFSWNGSILINSDGEQPCGVSVGVVHENGEGWLGVWVWANEPVRDRVLRLVSRSKPAGWEDQPESAAPAIVLSRWTRLAALDSNADIRLWFTDCLDVLRKVGAYKALSRVSKAAAAARRPAEEPGVNDEGLVGGQPTPAGPGRRSPTA